MPQSCQSFDAILEANNTVFCKMEFDTSAGPDETYFTEFGELRFYEKPKPKFAFYNPKAKKEELVCYSSTIRAVANCLPEAQAVARAYIEGKRTETVPAKEASASALEKEGDTEGADKEQYIFSKLVSEYGKEILTRNNLQVSIYNGQPKIWLKPWWRRVNDEGRVWFPGNSGFRFSIFDSARNLVAFSDRCLAQASKRYKESLHDPELAEFLDLVKEMEEKGVNFDQIEGGSLQVEKEMAGGGKEVAAANEAETSSAVGESAKEESKKPTGSRKRKLKY